MLVVRFISALGFCDPCMMEFLTHEHYVTKSLKSNKQQKDTHKNYVTVFRKFIYMKRKTEKERPEGGKHSISFIICLSDAVTVHANT
jgi:hypothetical protein